VPAWDGVRTSIDGHSLVVAVIGGRPYDANDPCTLDYRAHTTESSDEIRIQVVGIRPVQPGQDYVCTDEGHERLIDVPLSTPLDQRRVVNSDDGRDHVVFDGTALEEPSTLPAGWTRRSDWPGYTPGSWSQTWGPPPNCTTPQAQPLTLIQGGPDVVSHDPLLNDPSLTTSDVAVIGLPAQLRVASHGQISLTWTTPAGSFALRSGPACVNDQPPTSDSLLAVAEHLRRRDD
jgi:hypothetical protein